MPPDFRLSPTHAIILPLAALLVFTNLAVGDTPADSKIDPDLAKLHLHPIFVRMTDQLIGQAGDYERFCQEHQKQKRSELRPWVLKTLRDKSAQSWKKMSGVVEQLEHDGQVKDVQRFWIVNGFACQASEKACQQLAACEPVAFIYLERGGVPRRSAEAPTALSDDEKKICEQVLQDWKDDSEEPFSTEGLEIPWNLRMVQADAAWKEEKITGKGVVVAVCDSGLMRTPALLRAVWKNPKKELGQAADDHGYKDDLFGYDFANNSPFVLYDVDEPHGSMCAGIIAGRPLNSKKLITGVAPRSRLMVLRGDSLKMYEYAMAHGADVLSMSYGASAKSLGHYRGLYRTAFEHLAAGGVLASGGVGNHGRDWPKLEQIVSPKDIPCVLGTAGINKDGSHPPHSSVGPCFWEGVKFYSDHPRGKPLRKPDVAAPFGGFPLWGRPKDGEVVAKESDLCALVSGPWGNSFSCPHTAGVAALILSANPDLNPWEVKQIIQQTCKDLGDKDAFGAGLLQARDAVRAAKKMKK
jgi:hypothetical protein